MKRTKRRRNVGSAGSAHACATPTQRYEALVESLVAGLAPSMIEVNAILGAAGKSPGDLLGRFVACICRPACEKCGAIMTIRTSTRMGAESKAEWLECRPCGVKAPKRVIVSHK